LRRIPLLALIGLLLLAPAAQARWSTVPFRERVVSSPVLGGGYPGRSPSPGNCVPGAYDANFSESALAAFPGTDRLVGGAKAYWDRWSTFRSYHTVAFSIGARSASTQLVGGFDCVTARTQRMPPSWTNVTDPNLAIDTRGRVHQVGLPFNASWGTVEQPNGDIVGLYSDDRGRTWRQGNAGRPIQAGPEPSTSSDRYLDKPWVAVNTDRRTRTVDHVYGTWVEFSGDTAQIQTAVSRDRGASWSAPVTVPAPVALGPANPWPQLAVGRGGTVYLSFVSYGKGTAATLWVARSRDDGRSWADVHRVADTRVVRTCCLPHTRVHDGVVEYLAASPDRAGHVFVAWEELRGGQLDVRLAASRNGGRSWSRPARVNDDRGRTDQFQAQVAAGPRGAVAVAFYDKRARCPATDPAIRRPNRGRRNRCVGVSLQAFRDGGLARGPRRVGPNRRLSRHLWDPEQPAGKRGGVGQLACEESADPCDEIFIGDYFGLVVGPRRVHVLSASTHPASRVRADDGSRLHYQQQVLAEVSRARLGLR
jgi:hypothetical protein